MHTFQQPQWEVEAERIFEGRYQIEEAAVLGEGTYGKVYRGTCRENNENVAIKKMKMDVEEEGVPATALREIALLKELSHGNIVKLVDAFISTNTITLVLELVELDLKKYMKSKECPLDPHEIMEFTYQLCKGTAFCHASRILHRDLKPNNLLITRNRVLKIADFGLARLFSVPCPKYTHEVVTVWYRAPEILLGESPYSLPIDVWSMGCVLAEMATGHALFAGDSEIGTIMKIFEKLGTPTEEKWPAFRKGRLPHFHIYPNFKPKGWENIGNSVKQLGQAGLDLLDKFLVYEPKRRIAAHQAVKHHYFASAHLSCVGTH
mmetsp:Transcript_31039/g.70998  ORF Transcript_31039/g.70998 Transcript_31039/m.70998 type:complete len:320 (-) Transcript_31039:51-1010(-)